MVHSRSYRKLGEVSRIGLVALLVVLVAASPAQPVVVQEGVAGRAGVVVSIDPTTGERSVQLTKQGMPAYPTVDVTCDGKRRTIPLTRSEIAGPTIVATYEVPLDIAEGMLKTAQCRLLIPGHTIALPRRQLEAAWANGPKGSGAPKVLLAGVVEVIDGDTITVALSDRTETVRYIGVHTPETKHPLKRGEPGGPEAKEVNRQLVAGQRVRLELDVQERDRAGRLLAYVHVSDQMVNTELVRRGYAEVVTIPPNVRYHALFVKLQREAREQRRGLWADASGASLLPPLAQADHQTSKGQPGASPGARLDMSVFPPH